MKVRATTSFSVDRSDASITFEAVRRAVDEALTSFKDEHDLVEEASISWNDEVAFVSELNIVFRSDSYGAVDEAMLELAQHIQSALETQLDRACMDSHETQLVPA